MRIGDTILITKGRYKGHQTRILNLIYNNKVMVRINSIDVFIQTNHFVIVGFG